MTSYQREFSSNKIFYTDFPYRSIVKTDIPQFRNNPHPTYVRHIKGFLGLPMQLVETEKDENILRQGTIQGYINESMRRGDWNYRNKEEKFIKRSKNLDEILSLQYFTGLQNFSFKENYLPYLGYREYFTDWRQQLRNVTENTYGSLNGKPILKNENQSPVIQHPNEWINGNNNCKSMYSSTGRLCTSQDLERKLTSRSSVRSRQRLTSIRSNEITQTPDFNVLDATVFIILANILQTKSVHFVQSWLSQSSEREKALVISMIKAALANENKKEYSFDDDLNNKGTQTTSYAKTHIDSQNKTEFNREIFEKDQQHPDVLIVESVDTSEGVKVKNAEIRPPTSSIFRQSKASLAGGHSRKQNSSDSMWDQSKSVTF